jgi:hypothetical protein
MGDIDSQKKEEEKKKKKKKDVAMRGYEVTISEII